MRGDCGNQTLISCYCNNFNDDPSPGIPLFKTCINTVFLTTQLIGLDDYVKYNDCYDNTCSTFTLPPTSTTNAPTSRPTSPPTTSAPTFTASPTAPPPIPVVNPNVPQFGFNSVQFGVISYTYVTSVSGTIITKRLGVS